MNVLFGEFVFDGTRRTLVRAGTDVHLSPKAFRLLELLLSRRPAAVPRAEIEDVLWPGTFVSVGSLAVVAHELRTALGDDPRDHATIRTVHGFGYAFDGEAKPVLDPAEPSRHGVVWAGRLAPLVEGGNVLGRAEDATVYVGHPSVSHRHARIEVCGERALLEDLESKNGTWIGSMRVQGAVRLWDGDVIHLGSASLVYRGIPATPSRDTKTVP